MTSTIVLLAILDENSNPGTYHNKLKTGLTLNGLPSVKYNLGQNTARDLANIFCAANHNLQFTQNANNITRTDPPTGQAGTSGTHPLMQASSGGSQSQRYSSTGNIPSHLAARAPSPASPVRPTARTSSVSRYTNDIQKSAKRKGSVKGANKTQDDLSLTMMEKKQRIPKNIQAAAALPLSQGSNRQHVPQGVVVLNNHQVAPLTLYNELKTDTKKMSFRLAEKAKSYLPNGDTTGRGTVSVNELVEMIRVQDIQLDNPTKQNLMIKADMIQTAGYGDLKLSAEFTYSRGPIDFEQDFWNIE